ncbi:MAG: PmoA family protein [Candidatus Latescibacteria bacterium]|nr:PmoA family protein [Candidatus Latescibacterota bacterium]
MTSTAFRIERKDQQIDVFRAGSSDPIVTQQAILDHRPFLHPIMAPDGIGELTEYSPGHHPHQTGLYWGFTRVNGTETEPEVLKEWFYKADKPTDIQRQVGRDFFHHPGGEYWQRVSADVLIAAGSEVKWQTVYNMLDADGNAILVETQNWSLCERDEKIILDLQWQGQAQVETTIGEFPYGGMFLRMPFRKENGGQALNSEGAAQQEAEGQRARWVAVEMPIPGREETSEPLSSIAIMDHPSNPDHPTPWRADGQLGVGPSRGLSGDWNIPEGESVVFRHRLQVACGALDQEGIEQEWAAFAKA